MAAGRMMSPQQGTPVLIMKQGSQRETGYKAQKTNIMAAKAVADIIRTTLGPRSMLKMILDPMGGIVMTNDGAAILREIDVTHPAAKSMIELARTQDEEVGDGTTSVIILAGEMLHVALPFLADGELHPTEIVAAYRKALDDSLTVMDKMAKPIDTSDREVMLNIVRSCLGTKFVSRFGDLMCNLALDAVLTVATDLDDGTRKEIDIKRYAKIEKIPGDELTESKVLNGLMINKDVTHANMRRQIENPRILLLDCPLEYKKGESQTNIEMVNPDDWKKYLEIEEKFIEKMCQAIIDLKVDLIFTEKGVSDLAQHFLQRANITAIRRVRKSDNNRLARATGATIGHTPEQMRESDVGTQCGMFEVRKIGDEYWTFIEECKEPKACTVLLRGASKDVLSEVERNLNDAMNVARNVLVDPRALPGGGATEMAVAEALRAQSKAMPGVAARPYAAIANALEIIPRTLIENGAGHVFRTLTELRAKHAQARASPATGEGAAPMWGIDGDTGRVADIADIGVWEPVEVKTQTIKTAIESATILLRIDDIVSGVSKGKKAGGGPMGAGGEADGETFGDERDG
eukprot:63146_1